MDSAKQTAHASRQAQEQFNKTERESERDGETLSQTMLKGSSQWKKKIWPPEIRTERFDTDVVRRKGLRDLSDKKHT